MKQPELHECAAPPIRAISKLTGISVDRRAGWLTASAMAAASAWMLAFQRSLFALSGAIMLLPLASLVGVIARAHRRAATFSRAEAWLVYYAFSIFLGWITVTAVTNIAQNLTAFGWDGWGIDAQAWGRRLVAAGRLGRIRCDSGDEGQCAVCPDGLCCKK